MPLLNFDNTNEIYLDFDVLGMRLEGLLMGRVAFYYSLFRASKMNDEDIVLKIDKKWNVYHIKC